MNNIQIYSLVGLFLYFALLIFAVLRDKQKASVFEYFFGGRTLPFWALSLTFIASWWGAGSALSTADLAYDDGLSAFWYYGVPVLVSTLMMILFARMIRGVGYLTQGKMMASRYNNLVAKLLSLMILLFMTITAASQMVGIGQFGGEFLSIGYEWAVIAGTAIVLIYSFFGGFRGVVLTDIIQFIFLTLAALVVFFVAMHHADGFQGISARAMQLEKADYTDFWVGARKHFAYLVTFGTSWMIQANVWQRISATKTVGDAKKMTLMSFFVFIPLYLIVVLTGMAGLVLYETLPEGGVVLAITQDYLPPVLSALTFVGIISAIMSTMDSVINTAAMTFTLDIYPVKNEEKQLQLGKITTLLVTLVAIVIALRIQSILAVAWLASDIITTGVFVPLLGGFVWRRGNTKGALSSMTLGLIFSLYNLLIALDLPLPSAWEQQSVLQVVIGITLSLISYIGVSLLTSPEYDKADNFMRSARKGQETPA
ncbi:sodium:solute symporter family protein [Entomospira culicis]|uniref:Sodium:solute symporter family protein n=1 Tax=Entomospira culicis TaxID=2719989 RepID=A0A968GHQ0_9SPIO|nr:sodium:solute symporter family protein [Entomospira culicis]NIZ18964.1 sodium:solute symporter family protein [Entomospira culicis]NIZ69179.1 sodium:solute symporter family protein [Entomospira culicis]WDI37766.1 sodium:solute symporter family protein [Entomospira culicis]WDI39394.1 sodium:solute symporter family protein [Entomospira culicis]